MARKSNLDLIKECDDFPYAHISPEQYRAQLSAYYHFKAAGINATLGYIPEDVVQRMIWSSDWEINKDAKTVTLLPTTLQTRDEAIAKLCQENREKGTFKVLSGWRNELYGIYSPDRKLVANMERSASPLFGIVTFGVHMTAYIKDGEGIKIWTPRRAAHKSTYASMLDNTVAGGMSTGEDAFEALVRESVEEAGLSEAIVRKGAEACGTVTYFHIRDSKAGGETGLCQPECQYVFDLELPTSVIPAPNDDEVECFQLMTVEEVQEALANGDFKPNCALVLLDFFVRHGLLRHDNDKDYIEMVSRLHRWLEFPTP